MKEMVAIKAPEARYVDFQPQFLDQAPKKQDPTFPVMKLNSVFY